ncbi:sigma-70 family RNA polymerase sigma factor [Nannocystis sp. SCPEA4]|uniref:RNA polymerase sigma factor n=1 Tax=Nannocystis sp. SCPEA4 TaxID=2996787 RepID=UPI002271DE54|nr:sigma-70 family RNA polymerase sigma factor [Nannocystis sp. SCPEA4]MCY1059945.1 sigma-70 family RNA polymerase sigma factor [Nannocystis sp. SCPEA4]
MSGEAAQQDHELHRRWVAGDLAAGAALFDRYFDPITRFFRHKIGTASTAVHDDLIQTTFTTCIAVRERFRGEGSFRSYLFGIAYNVLRRYLEQRAREVQLDLGTASLQDLAPGVSTRAGARAEQTLLHAALRGLPVDLQLALELFYWESMSAREMAEILRVPEGTVRSRVRRARMLLRERLAVLAGDASERRAALAALGADDEEPAEE